MVREALSLPTLQADSVDHFTQAERIRRGDTLSSLLGRLGAFDNDFQAFVASNPLAKRVLQMKPGRTVLAELDDNGHVLRFSYRFSGLEEESVRPQQSGRRVVIERQADGFAARDEDAPIERQIASRFVEMRTTLAAAMAAGDIPDAVTAQLNDVFSASLDVSKDLASGDTVRLVYETVREAGSFDQPVAGRLLAVRLVAGGVPHEAVWFDPNRKVARGASPRELAALRKTAAKGEYFDFEGHSLRFSFLRNPLEVSRVMSGFTEARLHPILGDWRAHKGVDFAAPVGTNVRSVGEGTIEFVGQQRGYGNVIIVKHTKQISTLYAHLSAFNEDTVVGARVAQGDVIGFVGQTGWATGPHLHYEFRIDDEATDPLAVDLPDAAPPLEAADQQRFEVVAAQYRGELKRFGELQLARFQ